MIQFYRYQSRMDCQEGHKIEFKQHGVVTEESLSLEKERYIKPFSHTLNAFINSQGGILFVGVTDKGFIKGLHFTKNQKLHFRMSIVDMFNRYNPPVNKDAYDVKFQPVLRKDDTEYFGDDEVPSADDVIREHLLRSVNPCWCMLEANARKEFAVIPPLYIVEIRVKKGNMIHKNEAGLVFSRGHGSNMSQRMEGF